MIRTKLKFIAIFAFIFICAGVGTIAKAQCTDTWVTQAITELRGRGPIGSGNTGECNIYKYGNGSWSSYQDLKDKVWAANAGVIAADYENDPFNTRLCLDTSSFASGSPLVSYTCHGGKSQQFVIAANNTIRHVNDGMCLDGSNGSGGRLTSRPCNGSRQQQWYINNIPTADSIPQTMNNARSRKGGIVMGQIQNMANNLCVDIKGGQTGPGGEMLMWGCNGGIDRAWNQMFAFSPLLSYGSAYLFSRWFTPVGMGHTAWAVRILDNTNGQPRWMIGGFDGGIDAVVNKGGNNGWFMAVIEGADAESKVLQYFSRIDVPGQDPSTMDFQKYSHYKIFGSTGAANPAAAMTVAYRSKDWGYGVFGNNCVDQTYKVLNAYGVPVKRPGQLRIWPWEKPDPNAIVPNQWFQQQNGTEYAIR